MKHVIIGVGAAGITAAETIRKNRKEDEIVMISTDDTVISRCMLHKYIGGERSEEELSFVPKDFFESNKISWIKGKEVTEIDTSSKRVIFEGGGESYDKLLIATGAKSFFVPIVGLDEASNVYGLRDLSDAKAIRERAAKANHIVIIGAGLIGLDAAYALTEMGKKPIIIDMAPHVLSANLDERAAATYQSKFEEKGCKFYFGSKISKVQQDSASNITSVILDDKEELPCDLLIMAVGVRPNNSLLPNTTADEYLSIQKDVYVAGDVSALSENWPSAVTQGELAALNMCSIATYYNEERILRNTINFFGIASLSIGCLKPEPEDICEMREDKNRYQKVIIRDGIPVGVVLQGDVSRSGFWQHIIKNKVKVCDAPKSIWKTSFANSYGINEDGEYEWVALI